MRLTVLGSGSSGNGYVLQNDSEALVIECGMPVMAMKNALGFNIRKLRGSIVSHGHGDHAKYISKYSVFAPVYMSEGTAEETRNNGKHGIVRMKPLETVRIGGFYVIPFDVHHDSKEPFGFLIRHDEIGNLLFATDTAFLKYTFPKLTNIMIEANFDDGILDGNVKSGKVHPVLSKRIRQSHFSLKTCIEALEANDLSAVNNIVLLHLSDDNADENMFRKAVEAHTGRKVCVAKKGVEIEINKEL